MQSGFVARLNKFLVVKLEMIALVSLHKLVRHTCWSLEILCKIRVRPHIFSAGMQGGFCHAVIEVASV